MIEVLERTGMALGLRLGGVISREEYDETLLAQIREVASAHGRYRLLVVLEPGFAGFEARAELEDPDFGLKHRSYVLDRLAVVCADQAEAGAARLVGHLTAEPVRVYVPEDQEEAWAWITERHPHQHRSGTVAHLLGAEVQDPLGVELGKVVDLVFDLGSGTIRLLVVAGPTRRFTLPLHAVRLRQNGTVLLKLGDPDTSHPRPEHAAHPHEAWHPNARAFKFDAAPLFGGPHL